MYHPSEGRRDRPFVIKWTMSLFPDHRAYHTFSQEVRLSFRYLLSGYSRAFIEAFVQIAQTKLMLLHKETRLVRAQRGHEYRPLYDNDVHIGEIPTAHGPLSNEAAS